LDAETQTSVAIEKNSWKKVMAKIDFLSTI